MLKNEVLLRNLVSEAIRTAVDAVAKEHFSAVTQEHQLTSRIAADLEARLNGMIFFGHTLKIATQEVPDKGQGSLEKQTGIDLYIGVEFSGPFSRISKGLFIQAKWNGLKRSAQGHAGLVNQCEKMTSKSPIGSHVWLYGPNGVEVVPASEVIIQRNVPPELLASRNVGEQFQDVFDCVDGDPRYGLPQGPNLRRQLATMLQELSIGNGIAIDLSGPTDLK